MILSRGGSCDPLSVGAEGGAGPGKMPLRVNFPDLFMALLRGERCGAPLKLVDCRLRTCFTHIMLHHLVTKYIAPSFHAQDVAIQSCLSLPVATRKGYTPTGVHYVRMMYMSQRLTPHAQMHLTLLRACADSCHGPFALSSTYAGGTVSGGVPRVPQDE